MRAAASAACVLALHRLVLMDAAGLATDRALAQAVSAMGVSHAKTVRLLLLGAPAGQAAAWWGSHH